MAVTLDTGSSDLWIPATSSTKCQAAKCDDGSFSYTKSSTYEVLVPNGFNITYAGPGDSDAGDWGSDTITVGSSPPITGQTIGIALNGADRHGVMGVGYDTNEAYDSKADTLGVYPSALDQMKTQGIINRRAYSLYLNEYTATTGAVIFGGIDTTKYTGELVGLPLQLGPTHKQSEFYVTLTSVSFTDGTGAVTQLTGTDYAQSALLDSGTSATLINNEVFRGLAQGFGAVEYGDYGTFVVPCDYVKSNATINYQFGGADGPIITVPVSQVVGNLYFDDTGFSDTSGGCDFGFGPPIDGVVILGDTFLRSAYAVFDIDNNQAAIAQAVYSVSSSSVVAIPTGTTLPMVTSTATAIGTQLSGNAATSEYAPTSYSYEGAQGTTIAAGSPTFNLGVSQTTGDASSSGFAAGVPKPTQAALIGAGLLMGAMVL
jgi:hypothetical protein